MSYAKSVSTVVGVMLCAMCLAAEASAQVRVGVGVSVGRPPFYGARIITPRIVARVPYRPYYYPYRPGISIGFYSNYGYPYRYGYPYVYGYPYGSYAYPLPPPAYVSAVPGYAYGGVRIQGAPRDAQVFADGYYVGIVNDFDGVFQHLNLPAGAHRIEVRGPGLAPIAFQINVIPGETITYHAGY